MSYVLVRKSTSSFCTRAAYLALVWVTLATHTAFAEEVEFIIKQQPLATALNEFARQSDREILFTSDVVKEKDARAINGKYEPEQALDILLAESGLNYLITDGATFLVVNENEPEVSKVQDEETEPGSSGGNEIETQDPPDARNGDSEPGETVTEDDADGPLELRSQIVTGSRLRALFTGFPIVVMTREQIRQRGYGTVEDIVRGLPQNYSETNSATVLDNTIHSIDAQGQATVNLRGFGNNATLVLVNGRRWVQGSTVNRLGANGAVNINGIPFGAIERVEILTGGASAIYGADAQAGVVNFILRDTYSGAESTARIEMGAHDGDSRRLEQNIAFNWRGGNATLSLGYSEKDPVSRRKAGFTSSDFRPLGGSDRRTQPGTSGHRGQPGVISYGISQAGFTVPVLPLGALPQGDDGAAGVFLGLSPANLVPYDSLALGNPPVTSEGDSYFGHLSLSQTFLDQRLTAYADISVNYSDSFSLTGVPQVTAVVPYSNPYNDIFPHPLFVTVASYAFAAEVAAGILQAPARRSDQDQKAFTLGVNGELPFGDWVGDFSISSGRNHADFYNDGLDTALLAERLAGVDSSGNTRPMNQVVNLFGNGAAQNAEAVEGLISSASAITSRSSSEQDDYLVSANGSVFDLPAGSAQMAVGGEYRTEELDYRPDPNRSRIFSLPNPERKINSYFAELGLPLVGESNRFRGVESLWARLAMRYDDYSFSGPFEGAGASRSEKTFDNVSLKAEFMWSLTPAFRLRAAWSESFVPPSVNDLFGFQFGPFQFYRIVDIENPAAGVQVPNAYLGGNPDLKPEVSDTLAFGFDWIPRGALSGLNLSVTWFDTKFKDRIGSGALLLFTAPELVFEVPNMVVRDAQGLIERLNIFSINIASRVSESLDATLQYAFDTGPWGAFTLGVDATFTALLQEVSFPGGAPLDLHGTLQGPERWKARGFLGWDRANATLGLAMNYSSSYAVPAWAAPQTRVENHMTLDLTGSYQFGDSGWKLYAGARNITNRKFPFLNGVGGSPWDPRRVDTRGRVLHLEIRKTYDLF